MDPRRQILFSMLQAALGRVGGRDAVRAALEHSWLRHERPAIIAIGKAAAAMLLGARDALGGGLGPAILITKPGHAGTLAPGGDRLEIHETAHPVPDERSVRAGARLLEWIAALPREVPVLVLVSGGASSLVEVPRGGVALADLRALNERGLRDGWDIATLNAARARLSRLKGGGLTLALVGHAGVALFVSDVPGDDPAVIGSGLVGPAPAAAAGDDRLERHVVARIEDAVAAAAARAGALGLGVDCLAGRIDGAARDAGMQLARRLCAGPADVVVAGGETVVSLPDDPGRGGRNQQLALAAALALEGDADCVLMAVGTDGTDGPTDDAGGIVDGQTCRRIRDAGSEPLRALERADAGTALEAAGDLVHTGPTGTNVGDLVLGLRLSETRAAERLAARGERPGPML